MAGLRASVEANLPMLEAQAWKRLLSVVRKETLRGGEIMRGKVARFIKANGPYATGELRQKLNVQEKHSGDQYSAEVVDSTSYGKYAHEGRAPGKWPPLDAIRKWVLLKVRQGKIRLDSAGEVYRNRQGRFASSRTREVDSITFLIRRKIGTKGTEGVPFFDVVYRMDGPLVAESTGRRISREAVRILQGR